MDYSETISVASGRDACTLKQLVDLGVLPFVGAIKEKIEASPELQLAQAMENARLNPSEKLELTVFLTALTSKPSPEIIPAQE